MPPRSLPLSCVAPLAVIALAAGATRLPAAEPRIEIEICMESGFPIAGARDWSEMLGEMGLANVRLRGAKPADEPAIHESGKSDAKTFRVTGILTADGKLILPKARFTLADKGRIAAWFDKLQAGGEEAVTVKPVAFGLLPSDLVKVHEALAVPVKSATKGRLPREAAKEIADSLSLSFTSDTASQRALSTDEKVADELQGLSAGTALAAILRPLGLVLVPEKSGPTLRLRIADSRAAQEHWPVGWPSKENPGTTLPELFKFLNVEVSDTSLGETVAAIGGRVKAPIVIDYNALARLEVDLATKKVDLPKTNTFYSRALERVLYQAGLKYEVRVDEADKPFLWISSIRQ
jgi:hypothetical protein